MKSPAERWRVRKHAPQELLDAALGVGAGFATPPSCTQCGRAFQEEVIYRRVYELESGLALAAFCERCAATLPKGGAADIEFRDHLERSVLAQLPTQGRA
jgi:hypothetical protein